MMPCLQIRTCPPRRETSALTMPWLLGPMAGCHAPSARCHPLDPFRRGHDVAVTLPARSHGTAVPCWLPGCWERDPGERSGEQGRQARWPFRLLALSIHLPNLSTRLHFGCPRLLALRWTIAMLNPRAAFDMAARAPSGPPRRCSSPGAASHGTRWPRSCSSTSRRWTSSRRHCASTSTIRPRNPSTPRRSCRSG
jgi:hypothetical protein